MEFVQVVIDGILLGSVYALISIGLTLVFGISQIVNFSHGQFLMLGTYVAYVLWAYFGIDPIAGSLVAFGLVYCLGVLIQRTLINRVLHSDQQSQIFLTVALLILIENVMLAAVGPNYKSVNAPYRFASLDIQGLIIPMPSLIAFIVSAIMGLSLWLILERTSWGLSIRATSQDDLAARLVGINIKKTREVAFGLGVGLTALGGAILTPSFSISPTIGNDFVIIMFTVVVLGGLGNILGAVVGGVIVGLVQSISAAILSTQLQNLALFIIFMLTLMFMPDGVLHARKK